MRSPRTAPRRRRYRTALRRGYEWLDTPPIYRCDLVDVIFEQPYCRIANLVGAGIAKRLTASEYLGKLADMGVLTPVQAGREKLFIHRPLLNLLASETHEVSAYSSAGIALAVTVRV